MTSNDKMTDWTFANPAADRRKQQNHDLCGILLPEWELQIDIPCQECEGYFRKLQQVKH